jgi:hypothetical protein
LEERKSERGKSFSQLRNRRKGKEEREKEEGIFVEQKCRRAGAIMKERRHWICRSSDERLLKGKRQFGERRAKRSQWAKSRFVHCLPRITNGTTSDGIKKRGVSDSKDLSICWKQSKILCHNPSGNSTHKIHHSLEPGVLPED